MPRKTLIVHPILFAFLPVLTLYSVNVNQLKFTDVIWVMVLIVIATLFIWIVLTRFLKDVRKSSIIISGFLILFFSFGHVIRIGTNISFLIQKNTIIRLLLETSTGLAICLGLWLLLWVGLIFWVLRTKTNLNNPTSLLNIVSYGLILSAFLSNSRFTQQPTTTPIPITDDASKRWLKDRYAEEQPLSPGKTTYLPNIYFVTQIVGVLTLRAPYEINTITPAA